MGYCAAWHFKSVFVWLSVILSVSPSLSLSFSLSLFLSFSLSLSVCLSVCLNVSLSLSVSVCLSLSVCLSISLWPAVDQILQSCDYITLFLTSLDRLEVLMRCCCFLGCCFFSRFFSSYISLLNNLYICLIFLRLSLPLLGFSYKKYQNDHTLKPHSFIYIYMKGAKLELHCTVLVTPWWLASLSKWLDKRQQEK